MAPYWKFIIPFAGAAAGLWAWLTWADRWGFLAFVCIFFAGSVLGTVVFKRYATSEQIKADLEARKYNS